MMDLLIAKVNNNRLFLLATTEPKSILWINQGIYALIPIEIVRNEMSIQQDKAKISGIDPVCTFTWDQAIVIPPETGKVLAGEK